MPKLYAPEEYWALKKNDPEELSRIVNGCGPGNWKGKLISDSILGVRIKEACEIHDFMYRFGRSEHDRRKADRVFLNNMMRMTEAESSNVFSFWLRSTKAVAYYAIVRSVGGRYFWTTEKNPPETCIDPKEVEAAK